jgi:hypothetical protein
VKILRWLFLLLLTQQAYADTYIEFIPQAAKTVVAEIHQSAKLRDTKTLRKLMMSNFIWSFGGDASATQAIDSWLANPILFDELSRITSMDCISIETDIVECPKDADTGYRAGFKSTPKGWRMAYFVQGD